MNMKTHLIALNLIGLWSGFAIAQDEASFFPDPTAVSAEATREIIPPGRPDWLLNLESRHLGDRWSIVTAGPYPTAIECERDLSNEIKKATDEFINEYLASPLAARFLNYSGEELKTRFAPDMARYAETVSVSLGPHQQIHAKLRFTNDFCRELEHRWTSVRQSSRVMQVGLLSVVVLFVLSTVFGYFKADSIAGNRRASLQFASAGAILVIVVAGVAAARYLVWL